MSRPSGRGLLAILWIALVLPLLLSTRRLAYDDHLEPSVLMLQHHALPAADACWECHQPPLHYALQALAFAVTGAETPSARLAVARALAFGLTALLWGVGFALARRVSPKLHEQGLAWLFFLTLPAVFLLHVTLSNDVAAVALSALLFAWLARLLDPKAEPPTAGAWAIGGLLAGLGLLAKTTALPGVVVLGVAALAYGGAGRARLKALAASLGTALLVAGPWLAHNVVTSGRVLPLRMQAQVYAPADPGYFTSFRFLDLLAEPFARSPGATFLSHLDAPGPVDGSWLTRLYSLFFHESLGYLPPLWPPLVAALYGVGLVVVAFVGLGAWRVLREGRAWRLERLALGWVVASFALLVAFNLAYPSRLLVHGKAVFVLPAWPALFLLYVRGVQRAAEWAGGRLAPAVYSAHLTVQALFVAHAIALVARLVLD